MFPRQRHPAAGPLPSVAAILLTCMAACSPQPKAPSGAGLCWRMFEIADQKPRFELIGRDIPNLESCATQLEGARMMEGMPVSGVYNGHFIFVSEQQITSASSINGVRIRVFEPEDRRRIQQGLQTLIDDQRQGRIPPADAAENR